MSPEPASMFAFFPGPLARQTRGADRYLAPRVAQARLVAPSLQVTLECALRNLSKNFDFVRTISAGDPSIAQLELCNPSGRPLPDVGRSHLPEKRGSR